MTRLMLLRSRWLLVLAILAGVCGAMAQPKAPADSAQAIPSAQGAADWQRVQLSRGTDAYAFAVYANHDLNGDLSAVRQVVVIVHGLQRDAQNYFATAENLLGISGRNPAEVLLIAPQYLVMSDTGSRFDGMPKWGARDWAAGLDATGFTFALSSFAVIDDLLALVTDRARLPALGTIIVAGHSAGGQLVQRYAVLNRIDEQIRASGRELRYVVANPSSYLYFNDLRPAARGFAPYDASLCPAYDQYRYGLQAMIPYGAGIDGTTLFRRYARRAVTYLLGTADNDPDHRVLDRSCPAMAQGSTRLERGRAYLRYERLLAGRTARVHHLAYEVNDVGHSQSRMFGSVCGMMTLMQSEPPPGYRGASCGPYLF